MSPKPQHRPEQRYAGRAGGLWRGAPYTYVTTEKFLIAFDLESLQDLPDREQLVDAGVAGEGPQVAFG